MRHAMVGCPFLYQRFLCIVMWRLISFRSPEPFPEYTILTYSLPEFLAFVCVCVERGMMDSIRVG